MKHLQLLIWIPAIIWIIVKLVFFQLGKAGDGYNVMVLLNLFMLLVVVVGKIYLINATTGSQGHLFDDLKSGMRSAGSYIIIISVFAFIYYSFIDVDMLEHRIQDRMEIEQTRIEHWDLMVEANPSLEQTTPEQYLQDAESGMRKMVNPQFMVIGGMLLLLITSAVYSIASSVLIRNVLFGGRKVK